MRDIFINPIYAQFQQLKLILTLNTKNDSNTVTQTHIVQYELNHAIHGC